MRSTPNWISFLIAVTMGRMRSRGWIGFCVVVGASLSSVAVYGQNTWSAVAGGQPVAYCQKMAAPTREVLWMTAEVDDADGLYVSEDGGVSFERRLLGARLLDWVVLDAERAMALMSDTNVGSTPFVQYTLDAGRTWERRGTLSQTAANLGVLWSQDGQRVLAQVSDGIYESLDGALTWTRLQFEAGRTHFGNGELILTIDPYSGDLFRSLNGGTTFDFSLPASELEDRDVSTVPRLYAVDAELGFALSSSFGLLRTADAGQTWAPIALPQVNGVSPVIHDIAFAADGLHGLMSVDDGEQNAISILGTTDGGDSWVFDRLPSDMLDNGALPVPGCFAFFSNTEAFAGSISVFNYPLLYIGGDDSGSVETPVDEPDDAGTRGGIGQRFGVGARNTGGLSDASRHSLVFVSDRDDSNCGCVISRVATANPNALMFFVLLLAWMVRRRGSRFTTYNM
jgi:hypothetical protein